MLTNKQIWSLIAFSTYPVLFLYSNNFSSVAAVQILLPLAISYSILTAFGIVFWLIRLKFSINKEKTYLILLLLSSVFLYYGHIHLNLYNSDFANLKIGDHSINFGRNRYLLIIMSILTLGLTILILRAKKLLKLTRLLSIFIFILVIQQVGIFIYKISSSIYKSRNNITEESFTAATNNYPDIYYIILDSYASRSTLQRSFKYDNSGFEDSLSKKGFNVVKNSTSNYPFTKFSLTSSLNFEYLDSKKYKYDENIFYNLKHNKISEYLKSKGYTYIFFDTGYGYREPLKNELAIKDSIDSDNTSDNDFFSLFIKTTLFSIYLGELSETQHEGFRRKINYALNSLPGISKMKNSKFIFLHLICPHAPYIFKENGLPQKYVASDSDFSKEAYLQQLKYISKKTQETVTNILKSSVREPIIIVQSDHGISFDNELTIDNKIAIKDRYTIINAIYAPEKIKKRFYQGISPVNTFRIITNELFNNNTPLLRDKSYFTNKTPPYQYTDITKQLDKSSRIEN